MVTIKELANGNWLIPYGSFDEAKKILALLEESNIDFKWTTGDAPTAMNVTARVGAIMISHGEIDAASVIYYAHHPKFDNYQQVYIEDIINYMIGDEVVIANHTEKMFIGTSGKIVCMGAIGCVVQVEELEHHGIVSADVKVDYSNLRRVVQM